MTHRHFPRYNDDADFTTNAPSYYEDLARKEKLIRLLAERIWGYEKILDDTLEEIQERFRAWDKNLEDFPDDVKVLLQQWLDDGTLDHIINDTIFNWKLDTAIFEQFRDSITAQLQQTEQELSSQLAQNIQYLNVKSFGAVGDGIADDTQSIKETLLQATTQKKGIRFPEGNFLITEPIVINDNEITMVTGDGQDKTKLIFDVSYFALTVKSYYTRPVEISNLSIIAKTKSTGRNGVKVSNDTWGSGVRLENVNILNFGGISLNLVETFNSSFNNMEIRGYNEGATRYGTLLKIDKLNNFGSNNTFKNVVFHVAKIGVQNFAGSAYDFIGCTFENLDLFLNITQLVGLSMYMSFTSCWYELVDKGIINAEINEYTLLPLTPVTKKAPVNRLFFSGNAASTTTWNNLLDETVNPFDYKHFSLRTGYYLQDSVVVRKKNFSDTFESTDVFTKSYGLDELNLQPHGVFRAGSYTIHVKVENDEGKIMRASFISDNYRVHLVGDVYDPDLIGTASKISPLWSDGTQLSMRAYGVNLVSCTFTVLYSEM